VGSISTGDIALAMAFIACGAVGTWLLLPNRHGWAKPAVAHAAGYALAGLSVLLFVLFWRPPGPFLTSLFFYAFGLASVAGGILTISSRNPVYSALWFASVVLSTSGLFLLTGAQFLAAGTVIVYAGAIIVTFLFVIMLAQSNGQAIYDRSSRSPARATLSCFVLLFALVYALLAVRATPRRTSAPDATATPLVRASRLADHYQMPPGSADAVVLDRALRSTARLTDEERPGTHVAGLGGTLYTDHLISAELTGVLLFVALVGALAIAAPRLPIRPGPPRITA
jgi:NADH-quinone oxidoreductase subunit J